MLSNAEKRAAYDQFGHAGVDPNMRGPAGRARKASAASPRPSATSSATSSASSAAAPPADAAAARSTAAATCPTRWKSRWRKPPRQGRPDPHPVLGRAATPATAPAPSRARRPRPAPPATARAWCRCARASSACSRPARIAAARGKIIPEPCTTCHGQGRVKKQKTLEVKIPAGIDDGMRIRSAGNGEPGTNGGPPGDLYIEIRLKKHDIFERDGDDLHCAVPISFTRAALGGEIEVPTLQGKAAIDIPEGTQAGKQFRLRGKGIKGVRSSYPGRPVLPHRGRNAGEAHRAPAQAAQGTGRVAQEGRRQALSQRGELGRQAAGLFQP